MTNTISLPETIHRNKHSVCVVTQDLSTLACAHVVVIVLGLYTLTSCNVLMLNNAVEFMYVMLSLFGVVLGALTCCPTGPVSWIMQHKDFQVVVLHA